MFGGVCSHQSRRLSLGTANLTGSSSSRCFSCEHSQQCRKRGRSQHRHLCTNSHALENSIDWDEQNDLFFRTIQHHLRFEQDDEFYDIDAEDQVTDAVGVSSLSRYCCIILMILWIGQIIEDGTVVEKDGSSNFLADRIFLDPEYWDMDI
jgi:hypothetical protein